MRYLVILFLLFAPLVAFGNPSSEARMQFLPTGNSSCSRMPTGVSCALTIAIAEAERATGPLSFQRGGIICINGDTATSTAASPVAWVWRQTVNANTLNGTIPVTASTAVLVGGADCWGVVGSGYLEFASGPLTEVSIIVFGQ